MILCGGDQVLFGLYSISIICLLVGGCIWGQGEDGNNFTKLVVGITVFTIGGCFGIIAILVNIYKEIKKMKKKKNFKLALKKSKTESLLPKNFICIKENPSEDSLDQLFRQNSKSLTNSTYNHSQINSTTKSDKPIIHQSSEKNRLYKNNTHTPAFYSNPVFDHNNIFPSPYPVSLQLPQIQKNNAAQKYSRSLYTAHTAGRL